jgi:hypothetical protein
MVEFWYCSFRAGIEAENPQGCGGTEHTEDLQRIARPFAWHKSPYQAPCFLGEWGTPNQKKRPTDFTIDKLTCGLLFLVGIGLLIFAALHEWNVVSLAFASMSLVFSVRDFLSYGRPDELYKNWLKIHLGNMIGGYIAAVTAFVVVNNMFPSFWGWFAPTLVGVPYILYWNRRLK